MTKQNGVDVWPNAAIWMRDELRSKVRYQQRAPVTAKLSSIFTGPWDLVGSQCSLSTQCIIGKLLTLTLGNPFDYNQYHWCFDVYSS